MKSADPIQWQSGQLGSCSAVDFDARWRCITMHGDALGGVTGPEVHRAGARHSIARGAADLLTVLLDRLGDAVVLQCRWQGGTKRPTPIVRQDRGEGGGRRRARSGQLGIRTTTRRMSGLSIPIPNAIVATTTGVRPVRKSRWT